MNYEEISDSKINCCVAMRMEGVDYDNNGDPLFAVDCFSETKGTHARVCFVGDGGEYTSFDPCNNPSDAWPIIVENDITVRGSGIAYYDGNECPAWISRHHKALRAAMICFLKMKDSQHD